MKKNLSKALILVLLAGLTNSVYGSTLETNNKLVHEQNEKNDLEIDSIQEDINKDFFGVERYNKLADQNNTPKIVNISDDKDIFSIEREDGSFITQAFIMDENGSLVSLTQDEYLNMDLSTNRESEEDINSRFFTTRYIQQSSSDVHRSDLNTRISQYVDNKTGTNASLNFSTSHSRSGTASISLTSTEVSAVNAQIGYSYSTSYSTATSMTMTVRPNMRGSIEFYPIMRKSVGDINVMETFWNIYINNYDYRQTSSKSVTSYFPLKRGAYLDGVITLVETKI
jgi:hypothetical protein